MVAEKKKREQRKGIKISLAHVTGGMAGPVGVFNLSFKKNVCDYTGARERAHSLE